MRDAELKHNIGIKVDEGIQPQQITQNLKLDIEREDAKSGLASWYFYSQASVNLLPVPVEPTSWV